MTWHEKIFRDLIMGLFLGLAVWATLGNMFNMMFRDDLFLLGHQGGRAGMYTSVDMEY